MGTWKETHTVLQDSAKERLLASLRNLGLTSYAARAYLTLLTEPATSAGKICMETGIPDSKIYYALEELSRRGLIIVQQGNPSLYKPVDAAQMADSLRREAEEDFKRRLQGIEVIAKDVGPILDSQEAGPGIELAYVVRGRRSILAQMTKAVESAREEALMIISAKDLLEGLLPSLRSAQKRGVKVKIAVFGNEKRVRGLRFKEVKVSNCDCNILITDSKHLITASHPEEEKAYAIISGDPNMISLSRGFYDSPACCSTVEQLSPPRQRNRRPKLTPVSERPSLSR